MEAMTAHRAHSISIAEGCRLMGIARSTYYDQPETAVDDTALVETMGEISDSFEAYGYRRMQAALRQSGIREPQEDQTIDARA